MIYIHDGSVKVDEYPVYLELINGDTVSVTVVPVENYLISFATNEEYYKWHNENVLMPDVLNFNEHP